MSRFPYRIYSKPELRIFQGLSIKTLFCDDCFISGATDLVVEVFNHWHSLGRPLEWYLFPFTWLWGSLNSDTLLRRKVQGLTTVFQQQRNEFHKLLLDILLELECVSKRDDSLKVFVSQCYPRDGASTQPRGAEAHSPRLFPASDITPCQSVRVTWSPLLTTPPFLKIIISLY